MNTTLNSRKIIPIKKLFPVFLLAYALFQIVTLTDYPFIHSDEPWLSGLTRTMMHEGDLSATEYFFDSWERYPHALKTLFHLLQMPFLGLFGYSAFSVRLLSVLFSLLTLTVFYKIALLVLKDEKISLAFILALSFDNQFLYASRLARQEIIILFVLALSFYIFIKNIDNTKIIFDLLLASTIGLAIGIHPNSFIVAAAIGLCYVYSIFLKKKKGTNLLIYLFALAGVAAFYVFLSFQMDPDFLVHFFDRGAQFNVDRSVFEKLTAFGPFIGNIFTQNSLTYYMPNIRIQLVGFALVLILSFFYFIKVSILQHAFVQKNSALFPYLFLSILGILFGIISIGRYNVTSIVFFFPFCYLLLFFFIGQLHADRLASLIIVFLVAIHTLLVSDIYPNDYRHYLQDLSNYVEKDSKVLSNLNTEFYFDYDRLIDYRNLSHIEDRSLEDYLLREGIERIVYYEELDEIYTSSPSYDGVYGSMDETLPQLKAFLSEHGREIGQFTAPVYGTNISSKIGQKKWKITVYAVTAWP
ncbi:MAG TPA: hypothetical protein DHN33_10825 [Eubacteriaceae bacterium]|nr:hypothetical protein [Eubacteriaceae bacterium]